MTDYFKSDVLLAVKERVYSYYTDNSLRVRVIKDTKTLRPGEIPIRLKLRVPKSLIRGSGPVEVIVPEDAIEAAYDNAR